MSTAGTPGVPGPAGRGAAGVRVPWPGGGLVQTDGSGKAKSLPVNDNRHAPRQLGRVGVCSRRRPIGPDLVFLWACLDKAFSLGHSTTAGRPMVPVDRS